ncbi:hypothetical protein ACLBOM_16310 [Escherichia coli]
MTSSNPDHPTGNIFDPRELALLAQAMEHDTRGGIRMDSRYVSWERLDHFDGVLVRVHMLSEGVRGDFGSISIGLNPAVGALYHHVTHLLVCDSPGWLATCMFCKARCSGRRGTTP